MNTEFICPVCKEKIKDENKIIYHLAYHIADIYRDLQNLIEILRQI